jgi:predicted anti-sigma-YlaC factor YlaD
MTETPTESLACARVRVLIESYVDGDLARENATLATQVREHLAGCADCRRQHHQAVSVPFRLRALTSPPPREELVGDVMRSIVPTRAGYRQAWTLIAPEAILAAFILWYLSGLDGLGSIASGIFGDLQGLAGWGSGTGSLPSVPRVDVLLLLALISLAAIAAYHLSVLIRIAPAALPGTRRTARE